MMILLLQKKRIKGIAVFLLLSISLLSLLANPAATATASHAELPKNKIIILDAGHGGADGGAVSADGTTESSINLAVVLRLRDFFSLMGYRTILTRTDETSLSDPDSGTLRQQKVSDTRNRVALINRVANAQLISIHQNTLPGHPEVHGAQVFFSDVFGSEYCAAAVQQALNDTVNVGNEKSTKPIGSSVYIMTHAVCPAILVECGFLSSSTETTLLKRADYQTKLAAAIGCGYLQYQQNR